MLDCIIRQFFIKKKFMRSFMDVFSYKYNKKKKKKAHRKSLEAVSAWTSGSTSSSLVLKYIT